MYISGTVEVSREGGDGIGGGGWVGGWVHHEPHHENRPCGGGVGEDNGDDGRGGWEVGEERDDGA